MDWNEYVVAQMVKDRLAEASATAERQALLRALDPGPGALRRLVGRGLIRVGQSLANARPATPRPTAG